MRKFYVYLSIIIAGAAAVALFSGNRENAPISAYSDAGEEFASERVKWELMRWRDPSTGKIPANIKAASLQFAQTLPGSYVQYKKRKSGKPFSQDWRRRGPFFVGGRTRALLIDTTGNQQGVIIAGGVSGGLWRSEDDGETWIKTTKPNQLQSVSCIAQDLRPGKTHIMYAGTGEFYGNSARISGDGVYKSTDGGRSWFLLESTSYGNFHSWESKFDYIWNIAVYDGDVYVANVPGGVYRSTDEGETWQAVLGDFDNSHSIFTDIAVTSVGVFYATLSQESFGGRTSEKYGVFRSTNGGDWTDITPDDFPAKFRRAVIGIAPSDEKQVYFVAESPGFGKLTTNSRGDSLWHSIWKYEYKSGDGGVWQDRSEFVPKPEKVRWQMNSQGSYDLVCKVKPDNPDVVIVGGVNLYRSTDGFTSNENITLIGGTCPDPNDTCWYHYRYPNQHADQHAAVFSPYDPDVMYTGSDGGVHKTLDVMSDFVDWISLNNGFFTTQFYTCAIDRADESNVRIIGGLQDNGTLLSIEDDISVPWEIPSNADGLCCAVADSGKAYYSAQNTNSPVKVKMWRSVYDENGDRIAKTRIDPAMGRGFIWDTRFVLDPNDNRRMYVSGGKMIYRNNNLDEIPVVDSNDSTTINWDTLTYTRLDSTNPNVAFPDAVMTVCAVSENPADILYYGTSYGEVFKIEGANEGDPSPENITGANFPAGAYVSCVEVDPRNGDVAFVVFSNYSVLSVFQTTDGGASWTFVSGNLEQSEDGKGAGPACHWLKILYVGDRPIYLLGTSVGLFATAYMNGPSTVWRQESPDLIGNSVVNMIDARQSDGFIAVATHGAGMFETYINSIPEAPKPVKLLSPENGAVAVLSEALLDWEGEEKETFYRVEISQYQDFSPLDAVFDPIRETSVSVAPLEQGYKKYYWRVFKSDAWGASGPSETFEFTTAIAPPEIIYPEHRSDTVPLNPVFIWEQVPGATGYRFNLSEKFSFSETLIDTIVPENRFQIENLEENKRYYWKLASADENGEGIFGAFRNFRTKSAASVSNEVKRGDGLYFESIYPNPIEKSAKIVFSLKRAGEVQIFAHSVSGAFSAGLERGIYPQGKHELSLDASFAPAGAYVIEIRYEGQSEYKFAIVR